MYMVSGMIEIWSLEDIKKAEISEDVDINDKLELAFKAIIAMQIAVKELALVIGDWYEKGVKRGAEIDALAKSLAGLGARKKIVGDVLKGKVGFNSDLFKKESDTVKEYMKDLEVLNYIV